MVQAERQQAEGFYTFREVLERDKLNIRYDALKEEHKLLIEKKDYEITQLRESLIKQSPRNNWLWAAGGVVVGMATTYGAYRMFNDD